MDPTSDNPERQTEDRAFSAPDSSAAEKRKTSDRPKLQMELELAREGEKVLKDKLNYDHNHEVTTCNAWNFLEVDQEKRDILNF